MTAQRGSSGPGTQAEVDVEVCPEAPFFEGHFPGRPLLPGAALLSSVVIPAVERSFPGLGAPRRLRRVRFMRGVRPGERLTLVLSRRMEGDLDLSFQVSCSGAPVASGQIFFR